MSPSGYIWCGLFVYALCTSYWLYDDVFPYVYDVGLIVYVNEGPTWVTCSWLRYYVEVWRTHFDAYGS